ncbi:PDR/VanB family oxidoreductase [Aeromicrobium ginsengisoli]|uniref:Oxidoreductase n=1 Tax=Aeromicrobium ginsengisoli TaxID=363867 RepID=A0A5M4FDL3_9ACTN|nr:PDR/VanB family oxidoreductase [Aeromicrobium ginsengisoli]KAA1397425.1 oxidoreductase [Aeromicrobium ginsengisoli]
MNEPTSDLSVRVDGRTDVGADLVVLDLVRADGGALPLWAPGAHVDVLLPSGLVRQYSLCGTEPDHWRIAVLREAAGRGGSAWLHTNAQAGSVLGIAGPRNHFAFEATGAPVVLIAGGVGITPILPMAVAAVAAGADVVLHYAGHEGRMAFVDELVALLGDRLVLHVAERGQRLDVDAVLGAAAGAVVRCCGPAGLVDAAERAAEAYGLDFHAERFVAEPLSAPVWAGDFEVEMASSGLTVTVPPDRSILEVAEENGVFVLSSCHEGTCGTCETPVLEGDVDHRDSILTPSERERGDLMYICVSRAACPRLVLEL